MRRKHRFGYRAWTAGLIAYGLVASCQAKAPMTGAGPSLTIDTASVIHTLSTKPNITFEDSTFNMPAVLQARKARAYHTQAAAALAAGSTKSQLLGVSTSSPCYTYANINYYNGPAPNTGDGLWVVTDAGTLYELNPSTLATIKSSGALGGFSKSAVMVSADNNRIYLVTTSGKLLIINANSPTLATITTVTLSGTGFAGSVPYIDYSMNTNPNDGEDVYVVAGNGTINKVHVTANGLTAVTTTLTTWAAGGALNYGGAVNVSDVPIVWKGIAYFGTVTGNFYAVDTNTSTVTSYNLAANTSATGTTAQITAAAALDFDPTTLVVREIFVPCGDRLNWIDVPTGTVTPSASLIADHVPATVYGTLASFPFTSTPLAGVTDSDWISIAAQNPSPSRWGGATSNPVYNTGKTGYTIKFDSSTSTIWAGNSTNKTIFQMDLGGNTVGGPYSTSAYGIPNELCVDKSGDVWVVMTNGQTVEYSGSGTVIKNSNAYGALWPQTDSAGNCWLTTGGGNVFQVAPSSLSQNYKVTGFTTSFSVAVDSSNSAWVTDQSANTVTKISSAGAKSPAITVGRGPSYIATDPLTQHLWTADNTGNTVTEVNPTTMAKGNQWPTPSGTYPSSKAPWCTAFDPSGHLWVGYVSPGNGVDELDKTTGASIQNISLSGYGNAYEMTFDNNGFGWVATDNGILKISPLGDLRNIFASTYYGTPGDGNNSYGFLSFKVNPASIGTYPVLSTVLQLTPSANQLNPDNLEFFQASPFQPGTTTFWQGYVGGTPNVDYNNRPTVSNLIATYSNQAIAAGTTLNFTMQPVSGQLNYPAQDGSFAHYVYAVQSQNEALQSAAHFYSNLTAPNAGDKPTLVINIDKTAAFDTTKPGISSQPYVDQSTHQVYVNSCNTLFQLDYSSIANYQSTTNTLFNMTEGGRTNGPIAGAAGAKKFVFPYGNVLSDGYRLVTMDSNPTTGQLYLNAFNASLSTAGDQLRYYWDPTPGTTSPCQQMIWDYIGGDVYFTTSNGYIERAQILQ